MHIGTKHTEEARQKMSNSQKGKIHSKETRQKLSDSMKGKQNCLGYKHTSEACKKISEAQKKRKGWMHTTEAKIKISEASKKRKYSKETLLKKSRSQKGAKGSNWKGGISPESIIIRMSIEYRLWRESVFARDNWICQECGKKGGELNAHHIKAFAKYPELRFAIDNGVTLCEKCHIDLHGLLKKQDNK